MYYFFNFAHNNVKEKKLCIRITVLSATLKLASTMQTAVIVNSHQSKSVVAIAMVGKLVAKVLTAKIAKDN